MRRAPARKGTSGLKKNIETFAVCMVFAAVLTAVNSFAAMSASVILRDGLGYVYALMAIAVLIWLSVTGKKRIGPEPGRLITVNWEYFFLGAAVLAVSTCSFIEIFPSYNLYLYRLDTVTQGPFLITRMIFSCIGFAVGPLLLTAGAVKTPVLKNLSIACASLWSFAYLVSECTFFIPLPDISLYLPRLGTAAFAAMSFCYIAMAGKVGLRQNAAGLRTCGGMLVIFSISDAVFWILYHNNVYHEMLVSSFLFAALLGGYFILFSLTLDRKFQKPAEVTGVEI